MIFKEEYTYGDTITVTAKPEFGYRLTGWDGYNSSNPIVQVIVEKEYHIKAIFGRDNQFSINTTCDQGTIHKSPNDEFFTYEDEVKRECRATASVAAMMSREQQPSGHAPMVKAMTILKAAMPR